uniref:HAT C-terminal dimerisation domain-containing protein n=1 Tax=Lactuca sativa TaxID=4236 RepID=A0A9R1X0V0_LACSA|nr:hypothetical protein LSAT_V11C700370020 [Lactuca sativa]
MPVSTVASESTFSTGGRVIDNYRSSFNTKTAEALICTQDWLRSTPANLELIGTMSSKHIEELNDKLAAIEIGKLFSIHFQNEKNLPMMFKKIWIDMLVRK